MKIKITVDIEISEEDFTSLREELTPELMHSKLDELQAEMTEGEMPADAAFSIKVEGAPEGFNFERRFAGKPSGEAPNPT